MTGIESLVASLGEADVEAVARAICKSEGLDPDEEGFDRVSNAPDASWSWQAVSRWRLRREEARKLIALHHGAANYFARQT